MPDEQDQFISDELESKPLLDDDTVTDEDAVGVDLDDEETPDEDDTDDEMAEIRNIMNPYDYEEAEQYHI